MSDLERFAAYLGPQSEYYAERIDQKARAHGMPLRIEALAAIMAGLATLHAALVEDGDVGSFRETVNECANQVIELAQVESSPRSAGSTT